MAEGGGARDGGASALGSADGFCKLWINEVSRVFYDRLNDKEDQEWFLRVLAKNLEMRWRMITSGHGQGGGMNAHLMGAGGGDSGPPKDVNEPWN